MPVLLVLCAGMVAMTVATYDYAEGAALWFRELEAKVEYRTPA